MAEPGVDEFGYTQGPFAYAPPAQPETWIQRLGRNRPADMEMDSSMEPPDLPHSDSGMPGASPMRPVYTGVSPVRGT